MRDRKVPAGRFAQETAPIPHEIDQPRHYRSLARDNTATANEVALQPANPVSIRSQGISQNVRAQTFLSLSEVIWVFVAFAGFVAFWTIVNTIANAGAMDHDMTESYVWGHEFQLGYYKHPPFWAWIAGAWFAVFPHRAWAFALLTAMNAGAGLLGSWFLIGRFADGDRRIAAALLLLLTPYYSWFAYRFNANTIFLSLWPWTAHFFVRSIDQRRRADAVLFGVFAALDMLSKYYAVLLLATCVIAASIHPKRKEYFASARPWLSIVVCAVLFAPHLWWLTQTGFLPFHFFAGETGHSWAFALRQTTNLVFESVAYLMPVLLVILFARRGAQSAPRVPWAEPRFVFLAILGFAPLLLTVISALAFRVVLSSGTAIATFCLSPLVLIEILGVARTKALRNITAWVVTGVSGISFALSPALARAHVSQTIRMLRSTPHPSEPLFELARAATQIWHSKTGKPLKIVAGTLTDAVATDGYGNSYADTIVFYSDDNPSEFIGFDFARSPWISRNRLARDGLLIVCPKKDVVCLKTASAFVQPQASYADVTLTHKFWIWQGSTMTFTLTIVPPRAQ